MGTTKTITLVEWNNGTAQQRSEWLEKGFLVREEDREQLDRQAFPWKYRKQP